VLEALNFLFHIVPRFASDMSTSYKSHLVQVNAIYLAWTLITMAIWLVSSELMGLNLLDLTMAYDA
jgi:uncharacterized membrane protein